MNHLPHLIVDLALVLLAGSATILLFKRIKQPLVLGYIIAGFLVGPHFKLFQQLLILKVLMLLQNLV
jgi:CPA2 family monovalent cation:H+ antiporter-2